MKKNHPEPPIVQAEDSWDAERRVLSYRYGTRELIEIHIPGTEEPSWRRDSDGTLNSIPLVQQIYVMFPKSVRAEVTIHLGEEALGMRPSRAPSEHAILGQVGRPLLEGVNGVYDVDRDFLLSWHGRPWRWRATGLEPDGSGGHIARLEVELGESAWFLNFKPQLYRTHYGYKFHEPWKFRPELRPISGWCSWEAHRRNVSQESLEETAAFCAEHFAPYGMRYIQLDDGFEKMPLPAVPTEPIPHAWLEIDEEKFPRGHEGILEAIRSQGLEPGIWTSVSIYNEEFREHFPENLIKDSRGEFVLGDWIKYLLDCSPETLAKHVEPYYRRLAELGYTYFKTDVTRHLYFDGIHQLVMTGEMSNGEAERRYRAFLEAARGAMGEKPFWLLSWGVMMDGAGLVDACRISMDALPTWSGLRMQIIESARWWHTQRIVWQNDPDHVCVRAEQEWVRSVLSTVSLTGGLFMLSDALEEYRKDPERVSMIQKCLPPLETSAGETGPLDTDYTAFTWTKFHGFGVLDDPPHVAEGMSEEEARNMAGWSPTMDDQHPLGSLWAIHLDTDAGRWCVVLRVGVLPLEAGAVSLERLGLGDGVYLAFDFWEQRYLGELRGELRCPNLEVGHCQVIALRRAVGRPQLLSSSRHVSQDAVSVVGQEWRSGELSLYLVGSAGMEVTYWIHSPGGGEAQVSGEGLEVLGVDGDGECVGIRVRFAGEGGVLRVG